MALNFSLNTAKTKLWMFQNTKYCEESCSKNYCNIITNFKQSSKNRKISTNRNICGFGPI